MDHLHEAGAHGIERFYGTAVVVLPMRLNQSLGQPLEAARVERQRCWRVLILECACLGVMVLSPAAGRGVGRPFRRSVMSRDSLARIRGTTNRSGAHLLQDRLRMPAVALAAQ